MFCVLLIVFKNFELVANILKVGDLHKNLDFWFLIKRQKGSSSFAKSIWQQLVGSDCFISCCLCCLVPTTLITSLGICVYNPSLQPSFFTKFSVAGVAVQNYTALRSEKELILSEMTFSVLQFRYPASVADIADAF